TFQDRYVRLPITILLTIKILFLMLLDDSTIYPLRSPFRFQNAEAADRFLPGVLDLGNSSSNSLEIKDSSLISRTIIPFIVSDTCPVSSETTTAKASLTSLTPIAARCLVPSSLLINGF